VVENMWGQFLNCPQGALQGDYRLSEEIEVSYDREAGRLEVLSEQKVRQTSDKGKAGEASSEKIKKVSDRLLRGGLIVLGTCFVALGILGIFLPLLPTTPFFLLAVACYARSSRRFYDWMLNNRVFGSYIRNYREGRGIPLKVKVVTIAVLWGTIIYSAFFVVDELYWRVILLVIAVGVTIHILKTRTLRQ
jgi:uncharacterized protein